MQMQIKYMSQGIVHANILGGYLADTNAYYIV